MLYSDTNIVRSLYDVQLIFRWALGSAILVMLAFMSYLTATFVIEAMAAANAVVQWKRYVILFFNDVP